MAPSLDLLRGDAEDVWLSPHSDDVCFSLGLLAYLRRTGTLLTVFPVSGFTASGGAPAPTGTERVTRTRLAEDQDFAHTCRLVPRYLKFPAARERRHDPFNAEAVRDVTAMIEPALAQALMGPTLGRLADRRRRLFCPIGIGGHVDHLAVVEAVLGLRPVLEPFYRLAFYEDLHYASNPDKRRLGLQWFSGRPALDGLHRLAWPMDASQQAQKLRLVRLYRSQMTPQLARIDAYHPAAAEPAAPHEAIWLGDP